MLSPQIEVSQEEPLQKVVSLLNEKEKELSELRQNFQQQADIAVIWQEKYLESQNETVKYRRDVKERDREIEGLKKNLNMLSAKVTELSSPRQPLTIVQELDKEAK
jgi:hypothetical protein